MSRIRIAKALMRIAKSLMAADADIDIAHNGSRGERIELAKSPSASAEALNLLAEDADKMVRAAVAKNPSCDEATLRLLAKDSEFLVKTSANQSLSLMAIKADIDIAHNGDFKERIELAGNPTCSEEAMMILCEDPDYEVRLTLAGNPNCSLNALFALGHDSNRRVGDAAEENYESRDWD